MGKLTQALRSGEGVRKAIRKTVRLARRILPAGGLALLAGGLVLPGGGTGLPAAAGNALSSETESIAEAEQGLTTATAAAAPGNGFSARGGTGVFAMDYDCLPIADSSMPSRYSLAEEGRKPTVRSQGDLGTCWALSAVSALESELLPQHSMVFSADHLSLQNGFQITQQEGGDYNMIMSYLSDWKGPVLESEDPYGDGVSPDGLKARVHVQEMRLLRGMQTAQIKQMILKYGAAQSSLCMDRTRTDTDEYHYYNSENCAYYDPFAEELNHDILILGWDDSFSRDNFRIKPRKDGAWICLNTWGEDFGEDGLFYVSYEDANLFRKGGIMYTSIESAENYDHVYENDSLGWQARQGFGAEDCYFAGVYTAQASEEIRAVGFYATGPYTAYNVYVIPEYEDASQLGQIGKLFETGGQTGSDTENENTSVRGVSYGWVPNPGFYTARLTQTVSLKKNQRYAVVVWIDTQNAVKPVAVEMAKDRYTQGVTTEGRETYLSADALSWENTQSVYGTNVCLKVYTEETGKGR